MTEQKVSTQDNFLNNLRKSKQPARVLMSNGKELIGVITGFDPFTFTLQIQDAELLVYKSAVAIIALEGPTPARATE